MISLNAIKNTYSDNGGQTVLRTLMVTNLADDFKVLSKRSRFSENSLAK